LTCDDYLYLQDTQLRMEQAAMAQTKLIHRQEAVNSLIPSVFRIRNPLGPGYDFPDKR
jgi:hypothetical protein